VGRDAARELTVATFHSFYVRTRAKYGKRISCRMSRFIHEIKGDGVPVEPEAGSPAALPGAGPGPSAP